VVSLSYLLERQDSLANEHIEEGLIHYALLKVSDCLAVVEKSLLSLVVPGEDQLVSRFPFLVEKLVEEASVLND